MTVPYNEFDGVIWHHSTEYVPNEFETFVKSVLKDRDFPFVYDNAYIWKIAEILWKLDLHKWSDYVVQDL